MAYSSETHVVQKGVQILRPGLTIDTGRNKPERTVRTQSVNACTRTSSSVPKGLVPIASDKCMRHG